MNRRGQPSFMTAGRTRFHSTRSSESPFKKAGCQDSGSLRNVDPGLPERFEYSRASVRTAFFERNQLPWFNPSLNTVHPENYRERSAGTFRPTAARTDRTPLSIMAVKLERDLQRQHRFGGDGG